MTVIGEAFIAVKPDTQGFAANAEKGVLGSVGGIAKKATAILGGAFAAAGAASFAKGAFTAAEESLKIARQTEAVIKSTGGAAGVSAGQVGALVDQLSRKNTVDDEAIQQGANLLLTFTNVRNEAGKNNDIFTQANQTLVDMAAALGTDVPASAIQLGKALNDPAAGITALTRVGVTFTDQQKEQIKAMQAAGDTAGAQRVILAELNKEFGGSAAAQATAADKLRLAWGNFQEELGARLLPVVEKVASFLAERLPGAMATVGRVVGRVQQALAPVIKGVQMFFNTLRTGFTEDEGTPVERFALVIRDKVLPVVQKVAAFIQRNLRPILIGLGVAFALITAPITTVIAALVLAYAKFQVVRDVVAVVVAAVRRVIDAFSDLGAFTREVWPQVAEAVRHAANVVEGVIKAVVAVVQALWRTFGDQILAVTKAVWGQIRASIELAINTVAGVIKLVLAVINGDWGKAWDALKGIVGGAWRFVEDTVRNGVGAIGAILRGAVTVIGGALDGAWDAIKRGAKGAVDAITGFFRDLPGNIGKLVEGGALAFLGAGAAIARGIVAGFKAAFGALGDAVSAVTGEIRDIIRDLGKGLINGVIDALNDMLPNSVGKVEVKGVTIFPGLNLPDNPIPRLQHGGVVRATAGGIQATIGEGGRDEVVAPLPPGFLAAMQRIADGNLGGGPSISIVEAASARQTAYEVVAEMRNADFQRTGVWD